MSSNNNNYNYMSKLIKHMNDRINEIWNWNQFTTTKKNNVKPSPSPRTRAESIARWKEKRKRPSASGTIRYPSRKKSADIRLRAADGKFSKPKSPNKKSNNK